MSGGGGDRVPPPSQHANGGEFLLQLLRRPSHQTPTPPQQTLAPPSTKSLPAQNLSLDPAVAALGPTFPFTPFSSNGHDLPWRPSPPHPPLAPHNYFARGFPQNLSTNPAHNWSPSPSPPPSEFNPNHHHNLQYNRQVLADEFRKQGFFGSKSRPDSAHQHERNLMFGSMPCEIQNSNGVTDGTAYGSGAVAGASDGLLPKKKEISQGNRRLNGLDVSFQNSSQNQGANSYASRNREQERRSSGGGPWGKDQQIVNYRAGVASPDARPPPGFANKPSNLGNWESGNRSFGNNVDRGKGSYGELSHGVVTSKDVDERERRFLPGQRKVYGNAMAQRSLSSQLDHPGPSAGSNLHSVSASDIEESLLALHSEVGEKGEKQGHRLQDNTRRGSGGGGIEFDGLDEHLLGSPSLEDGSDDKKELKPHRSSRDKDYRSDTRGQKLLGQRMRFSKSHIECRSDIHRLNAPFVAIYESLIPPEEEKVKQKQLLTSLEKLVSKEWPGARLYLYGSCANSFGVSKSDIDVCLAFEDPDVNKSEALLKLADMLQSDNFQNVQALTRARVPIVKLMEPVNGISCDICINNVLAVVNTKLLRDYSQIDVRLRQLAFIVKHWAKSRGVNVTYQGTLSSYAYVLMCIHFLQQRKPAILPCLQGMGRTYAVTVDNVECAYYDQVEKLSGFGSRNMESIAQLVWAFFSYWAYCHDYANDVISIRTGSLLSKRGKDWTRRIGNDRHLICIEDPFMISHDLGRVVDRYSIRVLREEFERAAEIMQYDPDPCVTLFEPYVPG